MCRTGCTSSRSTFGYCPSQGAVREDKDGQEMRAALLLFPGVGLPQTSTLTSASLPSRGAPSSSRSLLPTGKGRATSCWILALGHSYGVYRQCQLYRSSGTTKRMVAGGRDFQILAAGLQQLRMPGSHFHQPLL